MHGYYAETWLRRGGHASYLAFHLQIAGGTYLALG